MEQVILRNLNNSIEKLANDNHTAGMSCAAIDNDKVVWTHVWGMRDKKQSLPVTEDTIFRVASVSKHISCMTAMTLVDAGKVSLNTDISEYLGYYVRNPYHPDIPITMRHLMTHTSTIIERGSYNRILSADLPPFRLSEVLPEGAPGYSKDNFLKAKPGEKYDYSSFGTGILGAIVEKASSKHFSEYAHDVIFSPLGICASYDPEDLPGSSEIALPYQTGNIDAEQSEEWLRKSFENKKKLYSLPIGEAYRIPQGNVHIRARDLCKLMRIFFEDGTVDGVRILSENSLNEMLKVQFKDNRVSSGLGLHHYDYLADGLIGHYGRTFGAFTMIAFNKEEKKGVAILTNGTDIVDDEHGGNILCTQAMLEAYKSI